MAASFRNIQQLQDLAGCDILTVGLPLLLELQSSLNPVHHPLDLSVPASVAMPQHLTTEEDFNHIFEEDVCGKTVFDKSMTSFLHDLNQLEEKCRSLLNS